MRKFKKMSILIICLLTVILLASCSGADSNYFNDISAYTFWDNDGEQAIAQKNFYKVMDDFLSEGTIENGKIIGANGKTKKVAFFGFDGTRADAIANVAFDKASFDTNGYNHTPEFSGINLAKKSGGLYMAYCGGEKGKDTEQTTSTCSGWTTGLTGVWGSSHGVKTNDDIKNMDYKTIFLKYAELGLSTSLAFDWGQYFDLTLKNEVKYAMQNPQFDITFCDVDRKPVNNIDELRAQEKLGKKGKMYADNLEEYNYTANTKTSENAPYDSIMRDYLLNQIENDVDVLGGLFHNPDSNGHTYGFSNSNNKYVNSVRNADNYVYQIMQVLAEREITNNEEWLVLITADHGGIKKGHGGQSLEERNIWVACNKLINTKYFSENYNGYVIK